MAAILLATGDQGSMVAWYRGLVSRGHSLHTARDWIEMVQALLRERIEGLVVDPILPGTAVDSVVRLMAGRGPDGPAVVLVHGPGSADAEEVALAARAEEWRVKGVAAGDLHRAVEAALAARRAARPDLAGSLPPGVPPRSPDSPRTVLLADRDPASRAMMREFLRPLRCRVLELTDFDGLQGILRDPNVPHLDLAVIDELEDLDLPTTVRFVGRNSPATRVLAWTERVPEELIGAIDRRIEVLDKNCGQIRFLLTFRRLLGSRPLGSLGIPSPPGASPTSLPPRPELAD